MPLSDARCRSARPGPKLHTLTDGGGLQLWLQPYGGSPIVLGASRSWLALGVYPAIPLARARQARDDVRSLLAGGLDPAAERKRRADAQASAPTFRGIADEYVAKLRRENRSGATMAKIE